MGTQYLYPLGGGYIPFLAVCTPQPRQRKGSGKPRKKKIRAGPQPMGTNSLLVAEVVAPVRREFASNGGGTRSAFGTVRVVPNAK